MTEPAIDRATDYMNRVVTLLEMRREKKLTDKKSLSELRALVTEYQAEREMEKA